MRRALPAWQAVNHRNGILHPSPQLQAQGREQGRYLQSWCGQSNASDMRSNDEAAAESNWVSEVKVTSSVHAMHGQRIERQFSHMSEEEEGVRRMRAADASGKIWQARVVPVASASTAVGIFRELAGAGYQQQERLPAQEQAWLAAEAQQQEASLMEQAWRHEGEGGDELDDFDNGSVIVRSAGEEDDNGGWSYMNFMVAGSDNVGDGQVEEDGEGSIVECGSEEHTDTCVEEVSRGIAGKEGYAKAEG